MRRFFTAISVFLALAAQLATAHAQYARERDNRWPSERLNPQTEQRNVAGQFDYYALVLSWSPTYCSESSGDGDDTQCNRRDGKRFSFVLHGLWPQYVRGYPNDCRTPRRPFVPEPLIDSMLDIMPSKRLVIHEYRKHGTCSGLSPEGYFTLSRRMFQSIRIPDKYKNPMEMFFLSPEEVRSDIVRANPQLEPDMIAVACGGAGNRLKEIRVCFSRDGQPQACGDNENPRRLCSANRVYVPPVRSTARESL